MSFSVPPRAVEVILLVLVVRARVLSLISVLDPGLPWVGDMMVGGVIPLGEALRPLGL